jgi:hypothetical protein
MPARVVPAANGARWLLEGWNIFRAAPLAWVGLVFAYLFIVVLSSRLLYLGVAALALVTPALYVSFMAVARAASRHASISLDLVAEGFQRELRPQLLLGAIYGVCWGLIFVVAILVFDVPVLRDAAAQDAEGGTPDGLMLLLLYVPVMMMFWFAPLLVAWHGASPVKAIFFSVAGFLINWRAFAAYGVATGVAVLTLAMLVTIGARLVSSDLAPEALALPLLVAVYPVLLGSYYASYRDIFGYIAPGTDDEKAS